jgi:hypothetical protein
MRLACGDSADVFSRRSFIYLKDQRLDRGELTSVLRACVFDGLSPLFRFWRFVGLRLAPGAFQALGPNGASPDADASDGVGGLGYLEVVQTHLAPLAFAISLLVAAGFAEEMSAGASFEPIYLATAMIVIIDIVLFLGPPCFFAFELMECRERGLRDYTVLAARYVEDFERKWLGEASHAEEPLLGTPDLQSLADLGNSVGVVRNMRLAPVSIRLLAIIPPRRCRRCRHSSCSNILCRDGSKPS